MSRLLVCFLLMATLGGCGFGVEEVVIDYKSQTIAAPIGGAGGVQIKVTSADARASNRDRIGVKKNGYGWELSAIASKKDVPTLITEAIESELKARNFQLGQGPVFILVDVNKFYNDFKTGYLVGGAVGETLLTAQIRNANGQMFHAKSYNGEGQVDDIMIASGKYAKETMEKSLASAIKQMFEDTYFIQALFEAQRAVAARPSS